MRCRSVGETTIDSSNVTIQFGGSNAAETETTSTEGGVASNEQQKVTLTGATGGAFRQALDGYLTAAFVSNATAAQVESALETLGSVDDVTVSGGAGGPLILWGRTRVMP